ncbi:MAG: M48 family metallopeptidase [Pseudomonadota bacterium]
MAYRGGREPIGEDNVNVSHQSPLQEFVVLLGAALLFLAVAYGILGLLIDRAVDWVEPETERSLFAHFGEAFSNETASEAERVLQSLVNDLQACLDPGYRIDVTLSDNPMANAFALPGGRMIVTRGLLEQVASENGLAFVLAHELGHFANRDHLRGLGRGIVLTVMSSVVLGSDSSLNAVFSPASMAGQARFSRARESAADASALAAVHCHYGHVGGALEFFETLRDAAPSERNFLEPMHYFASHPDVATRIDDANALIADRARPLGPVTPLPLPLQ